jgi:hypothetical protein
MKRALISATGFPTDIVDPGAEFEIYTGPGAKLRWVDAPDEITLDWKLEFNEWIPDHGHVDPFAARIVGYGASGAQFARLFDDIKAGVFGEAAKEGKFFKAVQSVKDETLAKYGELEYDENGQPIDKYKPWSHNEDIPAWMTRAEAEEAFPDLVNDPDYKLYVTHMVEGDGCPFDPNQDPVLPRDAMPEWN